MQNHQTEDPSIFVACIEDLIQQFNDRFVDMHNMRGDFKLFAYPFDVNPEDVSEHFQIELIDFQSNEFLKFKFQSDEVPLKDFYKKYVSESNSFCNMVDHAKRIICMFGSTYMCEQLFSKMKFAKNKMRSRLTDDHLDGKLRLSTTKINVDIDKLSKNVQHQKVTLMCLLSS